MDEMFKNFHFNDKPEKLVTVINGMKLPDDYLAFMRGHNGGEGPLGKYNYGRFCPLEELQALNDDYEVPNWWPGYVAIGGIDDELWAYNPSKGIYCQIDLCNIAEDTYSTISNSLAEFLINMDKELEKFHREEESIEKMKRDFAEWTERFFKT